MAKCIGFYVCHRSPTNYSPPCVLTKTHHVDKNLYVPVIITTAVRFLVLVERVEMCQ